MARAPYQPVQVTEALRPQAAPVDTYVRPPTPSQDSGLMDLARGLSKLDAGLSNFVEEREAHRRQEDLLRGEAEFHKNNRLGYNEAIAQGLIPAYASKNFMQGYKAAQGSIAGADLEAKFNAAYDKWGGKNSEDPAAFDTFLGDFLKQNIQTNDPDVLRGLMPKVRSLTESGMNRYQNDRHNAVVQGSLNAHSAEIDNAIDEGNRSGLASPKGPDYPALFGRINAIRQKGIDSGLTAEKLDPQIVDAVTAKAIELRDPKVLDFLNQNVPGTTHSYGDTPYGRKAKAETMHTLEVMGRQAITREREEQERADKKAKADVTRRAVDAIIANPDGPLPDDLLNEGAKYDPDFKINAMKWKADVYSNKKLVDPEALTDLNWRIINGDGMAAIRRGLQNGVFTNKDDLVSAYRLAQEVEKGGKKLEDALSSNTARTILGAINIRTQDDRDVSKLFSPEGITDKGLAAQYDFKRFVMDWIVAHPNASLREQEAAINDIGAQILKRINDYELEGNVYNREGLPPINPHAPGYDPSASPLGPSKAPPIASDAGANNATGAAPPTPSSQPQGHSTAQPQATTIPVNPQAFQEWVADLTPPQLESLQEMATKQGATDFNAFATSKYQEGLQRGLIPANPQQPAPKPERRGDLEATVQPASLEAGANIVDQVGEAIRQWSEEDPVSADIVKQVGGLIEQAINGTGDYIKDFQLAELKDDPKAARILDFIAGPESAGNYNAIFGNARSKVDLSQFTVDQIIAQQKARVKAGSKSSVTGRYQFMRKTLEGLKKTMGLTGNERFTPLLQDKLAFQLLRQRGYDKWKAGKMTTTAFANALAMEWASLPNLSTGRSHYDGDGLNSAGVSSRQVLSALDGQRT